MRLAKRREKRSTYFRHCQILNDCVVEEIPQWEMVRIWRYRRKQAVDFSKNVGLCVICQPATDLWPISKNRRAQVTFLCWCLYVFIFIMISANIGHSGRIKLRRWTLQTSLNNFQWACHDSTNCTSKSASVIQIMSRLEDGSKKKTKTSWNHWRTLWNCMRSAKMLGYLTHPPATKCIIVSRSRCVIILFVRYLHRSVMHTSCWYFAIYTCIIGCLLPLITFQIQGSKRAVTVVLIRSRLAARVCVYVRYDGTVHSPEPTATHQTNNV